ncbi:hypothetical protein BpHYR1_034709 [Brachionus plicatilis]|uniref:Uncharacterized protein n=1 Tax=Brachionus plicatilis TaxID=10195 RepID=A0A3M7QIY3_BRAPC|nr:hypothetical protein BpHYR1_034709 [Brachionus plicatilis]
MFKELERNYEDCNTNLGKFIQLFNIFVMFSYGCMKRPTFWTEFPMQAKDFTTFFTDLADSSLDSFVTAISFKNFKPL